LLSSVGTFQEFYSIIDADIERLVTPEVTGRLFKLPVYHVENFLLDTNIIFQLAKNLLLDKCPYKHVEDIEEKLINLLKDDHHLLPFTRAVFDAAVANKAKEAWDFVYKKDSTGLTSLSFPIFDEMKKQAILRIDESIVNGSWKTTCKGRDLLKAFCSLHGFNYEQFRNLIISKLESPPRELQNIINQMGVTRRACYCNML